MIWFRPAGADDPRLAEVAAAVLGGEIAIVPTETVYGLACLADDPRAITKVFKAKGRTPDKPLIVAATEIAQARMLCSDWPEIAEKLATAFWPGPLTIVLPKAIAVPDLVTAGGNTVAVRIPNQTVLLRLIDLVGRPLTATSANQSSQPSPLSAEEAVRQLGPTCAYVVDCGPTSVGKESTIVQIAGNTVAILREGAIPLCEIELAAM
ncbi:MAG: L-threonylcarbamoyladenylate synthase [Fimbriimonadales bacterium]